MNKKAFKALNQKWFGAEETKSKLIFDQPSYMSTHHLFQGNLII